MTGLACAPHRQYNEMCVLTYANGYNDKEGNFKKINQDSISGPDNSALLAENRKKKENVKNLLS